MSNEARHRYLTTHIATIANEVRHGLQAIPHNFEGIQAITSALDSFEHHALLDPRSSGTDMHFRELRRYCTRFRADVYPEMLEAGFRAIQNTPAEDDAREVERVRAAYMENMRREYRSLSQSIQRDAGLFDYSRLLEPHNDEAEKRGMDLLVENLSEKQTVQWIEHNWFEVIGNSSGKTYRLHKARQLNILRYDRKGLPEACYCFLPSNGVVLGDVLLGQKLALETDEKKTLRIANKFGPEQCRAALSGLAAGGMFRVSPRAYRGDYGVGLANILQRMGFTG